METVTVLDSEKFSTDLDFKGKYSNESQLNSECRVTVSKYFQFSSIV